MTRILSPSYWRANASPSCKAPRSASARRSGSLTRPKPPISKTPASADAVPPVRAGVLQCQGGQNVGFVVGSVASLECVFRSEGRRPEPYIAKVQRIGLDLGVTEQTQ